MKLLNDLTEAQVHYEFLTNEWYKPAFDLLREQGIFPDRLNPLNPQDAQTIKDALYDFRAPLLGRIPANTTWHRVRLELSDWEQLFVIKESHWDEIFGHNQTIHDAATSIQQGEKDSFELIVPKIRSIKQNIGTHSFTHRLMIIGKDMSGPHTVIEGNHRAVAFWLHQLETGSTTHLPSEVILGISPDMQDCAWVNGIHKHKVALNSHVA